MAEQPLDSWDKDAVQYHKSYANATSFGNSPYSYGINDMNYYGSFVNVRVLRLDVAAVLYQRELGSVRERRLGLLSERRLFLGVSVSVGLDTLPLRQLGFLPGRRLGLAAGRRMDGTGKQFVCHAAGPNRPAIRQGHSSAHPCAMQRRWCR